MTRVDQFESVFKSASKTLHDYAPVHIESVLVVTDLEETEAAALEKRVQGFLRGLGEGPRRWEVVKGTEARSVGDVLERIRRTEPDLICAYRSLHSDAWRWSYTLGQHLDVLAQETAVPVLVLPNPRAEPEAGARAPADYGETGTRTVMAMTDHLTGDHRLVNFAAAFTLPGGRLILTHLESDGDFERYLEVISKIPTIDTENARETIQAQLLKEPHDYVGSCAAALREAGVDLNIDEIVRMGHRVSVCRELVENEKVDLLVLNTKDEDQMAMHGLAYPVVVELRRIPVLML